MNLIKQIVKPGEYGTQTIKMIVRSNERGAQGEQGEKGDAATITAGNAYSVEEGQSPAVINTGTSSDAVFDFYLPKGPKGDDGAIHYTAGTGINITSENVIEATGDATAAWGGIQGDIADQTDLQNEFGLYTKTADLPNLSTAYVGTNNLVDGAVATAKIADGAVITAKIDNGAVTASKFAQYAVNAATKTANNITPSADTPEAWATALGGDGYFWTFYTQSGCFAKQPSQYGQLETIITGPQIYQRWHEHATGPCAYRGGNSIGWNGSASDSGGFLFIKDSKTAYVPTNAHSIAQNSDLNTIEFVQPGAYVCNYTATVQTLSNCPATTAFRMTVENLLDSGTEISSSNAWKYFFRTIVDIEGRVWQQRVSSNGSDPVVWTYGAWNMMSSGNDGPVLIDNVLDIASGHIVDEYYFYRQGKFLYFNTVLHKTSGNFGGGELVATLKRPYYPAYPINYMCALAINSMWTTNTPGYLYISSANGQITVGDATAGCSYAKITLTYPIA